MPDMIMNVLLAAITALIALAISYSIAFSFPGIFSENQADEMKVLLERVSGLIDVQKDADICFNYKEIAPGQFEYNVKIAAMKVSIGKDVTVMPIVTFKDARMEPNNEEKTFLLEKNKYNSIGDLTYTVRTSVPPIKSNFYSGQLLQGQKILKSNFIVEYKEPIQIRPGALNYMPDNNIINIVQGPCTHVFNLECKDTTMPLFIYLDDDEKTCNEQETTENCKKSMSFCNGEAIIILSKYQKPDESCPDKEPIFTMNFPKTADPWETGEEILVSFWVMPNDDENPNLADCWKEDFAHISDACLERNAGVYSAIIPIDQTCP